VKRLLAVIAATALILGMASPVFADNTGYEGQPGNQSNGGNNNHDNGNNSNNPPPGN
jgi:hypothetical protein